MKALEAQRQADEELDHESPIDELFEDQIGAANLILISKSDMCSEDDIATVKDKLLAELEYPTPTITISKDNVPVSAILGLHMDDADFERASHSHHHHHHHHDDEHDHDHHDHPIMNMVMMSLKFHFANREIADGEALAGLSDVARAHQILRAKGAMQIAGKALPLIVQAVGSRVDSYFVSQCLNIGALVIIGLKGLDKDVMKQP